MATDTLTVLQTEEREYLLELLQNARNELLHELHHSDTGTFDDLLKERIALNEELEERFQNA